MVVERPQRKNAFADLRDGCACFSTDGKDRLEYVVDLDGNWEVVVEIVGVAEDECKEIPILYAGPRPRKATADEVHQNDAKSPDIGTARIEWRTFSVESAQDL